MYSSFSGVTLNRYIFLYPSTMNSPTFISWLLLWCQYFCRYHWNSNKFGLRPHRKSQKKSENNNYEAMVRDPSVSNIHLWLIVSQGKIGYRISCISGCSFGKDTHQLTPQTPRVFPIRQRDCWSFFVLFRALYFINYTRLIKSDTVILCPKV